MISNDAANAKFRQACGFAEELLLIAEEQGDNVYRHQSCLLGAMLQIDQAIFYLGQRYLDDSDLALWLAAKSVDEDILTRLSSQKSNPSSALFYRELLRCGLGGFWSIKKHYSISTDMSFCGHSSAADPTLSSVIATDASAEMGQNLEIDSGAANAEDFRLSVNSGRKWIAALYTVDELLHSMDIEY